MSPLGYKQPDRLWERCWHDITVLRLGQLYMGFAMIVNECPIFQSTRKCDTSRSNMGPRRWRPGRPRRMESVPDSKDCSNAAQTVWHPKGFKQSFLDSPDWFLEKLAIVSLGFAISNAAWVCQQVGNWHLFHATVTIEGCTPLFFGGGGHYSYDHSIVEQLPRFSRQRFLIICEKTTTPTSYDAKNLMFWWQSDTNLNIYIVTQLPVL